MHGGSRIGAIRAMAASLQHSPRQRSYDDLTDAEVEEIGHTLDAPRAKVSADLVARTTDLGG
jgi:NADPH-dependent stearoyl-CoA 9-desaturase